MIKTIQCAMLSVCFLSVSLPAVSDESRPKLIVVVSVDQLRRDRLDVDSTGAVGRLLKQGRVFTKAQLDHAVTNTCPGHAVILSGTSPGRAGVPGNNYIDHETFTERYCVGDDDDATRVLGGKENRSPKNLKVTTLGDWLKQENVDSRVFAVAGKDRAAIAMGGHKADGAFWFDSTSGRFTTSGYYAPELADYVRRFNGENSFEDGHFADVPQQWQHAEGDFRVDDYEGESTRFKRISGHPLRNDSGSFEPVYVSPWLDLSTFALATEIVKTQALGTDNVTDLLAIGLSGTDIIGHHYGPRSAEAADALERLDQGFDTFLKMLDEKVGASNYLVVVTADHGVAELPEYRDEQGSKCPVPGRLSVEKLVTSIYWDLFWKFTLPHWSADAFKISGSQLFFNRAFLSKHDLDLDEGIEVLDQIMTDQDIVKAAWSAEEISAGRSEEARLYRNSYVAGLSGDLLLQTHEDCVITRESGTTHGSPYDYDRNIPLIFMGRGIIAGADESEAHSVDIATTLADWLDLDRPANLQGQVLKLD
jgi:predicted AlkP superfamily pyrophosphatase or phosphodiesterase